MKFFRKKRNIIIICLGIIISCIAMSSFLFLYPAIYQYQCKTRIYSDLEEKLEADICSANIRIVTKLTETSENVSSFSYRENGSGVIFRYDEAKKSADDYYGQFPVASVEYISRKCDLAIVRFESDATASDISYGEVTSKDYEVFDSNDYLNPDKAIYHNAYIVPGFSGGVVLNEQMDVA